jgi:hypothetical protein
LTQKDRLWKVPVSSNLVAGAFGSPVGAESARIRASLPLPYDHFGDPDQYGGYVFIPVEAPADSSMPIVAVYRASDLAYVGSAELTLNRTVARNAAWIAIRETQGRVLLYSSSSVVSATQPIFVYEVDMDMVAAGSVSGSLSEEPPFRLDTEDIPILYRRFDATPEPEPIVRLIDELTTTQGGVFTPYGDFYLSSNQGVFLFAPDGSLIAASENRFTGTGFRYEFNDSLVTGEEPEGLDWWDLTHSLSGPNAPSVYGQLHVVLLDNDLLSDDDVYIKHYEVDYGCRAAVDSDEDGVNDYDEVEQYGTDPLDADTDDDGTLDGADAFPLDPTEDTDTDGDGTGDNADTDDDNDGTLDGADAFPRDPTEDTDTDGDGTGDNADTDDDNDGQLDVDESACGSDPLDGSSLSLDFDSDNIPDCVDPDIDGDTVANGDDICAYTELPDEPTAGLRGARFAARADGTFDSGKDEFDSLYTLADTQGCAGTQVIELEGLGAGHTRYGISRSALEGFIAGRNGG